MLTGRHWWYLGQSYFYNFRYFFLLKHSKERKHCWVKSNLQVGDNGITLTSRYWYAQALRRVRNNVILALRVHTLAKASLHCDTRRHRRRQFHQFQFPPHTTCPIQ